MITGNIGEWSEIYTLFKLLSVKNLQSGNENFKQIENLIYPILKILRTETNGDFQYSIEDDIVLISGGDEVLRIPIQTFKEKATFLLNSIKSNKKRTFSIPEIEEFMQSINCISLKADSKAKTDITIVIHDQKTSQQQTLGFSIKSQLGSPSTLLNAGKTTNFIFQIQNINLSTEDIIRINSIETRSKVKDRIKEVINNGGTFKFITTERKIFSNNLVLIDSLLPQILSEFIFVFYNSKHSKTSDLINVVELDNPLGFDTTNEHQFYNYKIKRFLTDSALGMMSSKVWDGKYEATGGHLIVKEDGDILCYHIYNRNEFEEYLINNTKLETASTTRHDFGSIYEEGGKQYFKLNLQVRFIK